MRLKLGISVALVAMTIAIYAQTLEFQFLNYDDPGNVAGRPEILHGLSSDGVRWAFTTTFVGNFIPVTGITYLTDYTFFGLHPGGFHATNVAFHCANATLLFLVLTSLTQRIWPSALVAALFAVHPLHVESVAWISERKDVVSTFFGLAVIGAYVRYARRKSYLAYALACVLFLLSLLAKSMLVTLPCALLLLDFWPLNRAGMSRSDIRRWLWLACEKVPFAILAAIVSVVTIIVQGESGAIPSTDLLSFPVRVANALVSYMRYLTAMVWPRDLIPYYAHPQDGLPAWQVAAAAILLLTVTAAAWLLRKRWPYFLVGWLWYVGTLVPVIGLVQVGGQAMADRYTYIPLIGIFVVIAWALADVVRAVPKSQHGIAAVCVIVLAVFGAFAYQQTARWRSSITLFEYTLSVDPTNSVALGNLGEAYVAAGRYEDAVRTTTLALQLRPGNAGNLRNLGSALRRLRRLDEAEDALRRSLELQPRSARGHNQLALVLMDRGRLDEAEQALRTAQQIDPEFLDAQLNYGNLWLRRGQLELAAGQYEFVLARRPRDVDALTNLGTVKLFQADYPAAVDRFRKALAIAPDDAVTRTNLGVALFAMGRIEEARREAETALEYDPEYAKAKGLLQDIEQADGMPR